MTSASGGAPKRGRPVGSVSLNKETYATIVNYVRAGALPHAAAEAAGISPRTFHDWMERGEERHPTRKPTPKLIAFARDVNQARAQFRITMEMRVAQEDPKYYLRYAARDRVGYEGWSDPAPETAKDEAKGQPSVLEQAIAELDQREQRQREAHEASCTDQACIAKGHKKSNNKHAGNVRCDDPDHRDPSRSSGPIRKPPTNQGGAHR